MAGERVVGLQRVLVAMREVPVQQEIELERELDVSSQLLIRSMAQRARKWRSLMATGIHARRPQPLTRDVGPSAAYAVPQEEGIRPGGKGLPAFGTVEAADITAWLRSKPLRAVGRVRRATFAGAIEAISLRDRYFGLARYIRRHGIKAGPFVKPAFDELAPVIEARLQAAAQRGIDRTGSAA
jgi:hypothetical protein